MAAPHVAGLIALVAAANPSLTATERRNLLQATSNNVKDLVVENSSYRSINAAGAVEQAAALNRGQQIVSGEETSLPLMEEISRVIVTPDSGNENSLTEIIETLSSNGSRFSIQYDKQGTGDPTLMIVAPTDSLRQLEAMNPNVQFDNLSAPFVE